jgi:serine protease Do
MSTGRIRLAAPLLLAVTLGGWQTASAQQLRDLFRRLSPSVVVVRTLEKALAPEPGGGLVTAGGLGSGTIISADGKILTAAHVVQTADRVGVELKDGRFFTAKVVASAPRADVALLKLDDPPGNLVPARLGNSDLLETGDDVVVIGAPFGLSYTLTAGHVSGRLRPKGTINGSAMEFIETDASINQGNSGGPMFSLQGELIGVVSHILTQSGGFEGLGFAVSSNVAEKLLLSTASFWTGVDGFLLTGDLARVFNVPQSAGLLIQQMADGSPGALLGLRAGTLQVKIGDQELILGGDIVLEVGGIPVSENSAAEDRAEGYLRALPLGAPIEVRVLRAGKVLTLTAVKRG